MLKKMLVITIVLTSSIAQAQKLESHHKKAKFKFFDPSILDLRNGDTTIGYAKLIGDSRILFTEKEGATRVIYDYKKVKKLKLLIENDTIEYHYKILEGKKSGGKVKLLELELAGKVNLFSEYVGAGSPSAKTNYFMSKEGEDKITNLRIGNTYSDKFKAIAAHFFSDCQELINKINDKGFKRYDIVPVVKYYNNKCK